MSRRRWSLVVLGCLEVIAAGCATARPIHHPNFAARQAHFHALALLPPAVDVYKQSFAAGQELMPELLPVTRQRTLTALRAALIHRGYHVTVAETAQALQTGSSEAKNSLYMVQELLAQRMQDYQAHGWWRPRAFNYSVGPAANVLADATQSDALLLASCYGIKKSGGEIAKDWMQTLLIGAATLGTLTVVYYPSVTLLQLALVDGDTGDILWYVDNGFDMRFDVANEKRLSVALQRMVAKFPAASAAPPRPHQPSAPQAYLEAFRNRLAVAHRKLPPDGTGEVVLLVTVGRDGDLRRVEIQQDRSTAAPQYWKTAIQSVRDTFPLQPFPPEWPEAERRFEIPIRFGAISM